jgi:hypothetical protein
MVLPAVGLDDQPPLAPEEVDLKAGRGGVHRGPRQAEPVAELQEQVLEVAARERRLLVPRQRPPDCGSPGTARIAAERRLDLAQVEEAQPLGLLDRLLQRLG